MLKPVESTIPMSEHSQQNQSETAVDCKIDMNEKDFTNRRHDLDALRATAMLLGIVLHAALSFAPIPWTVKDNQQSDFYEVLFASIHGFRMPLFFLVSGFFTAMLWRKYGLGGLIKQRLKRILIPLIIGFLTLVPLTWVIMAKSVASSKDSNVIPYFDAAANGNTEILKIGLKFRSIKIDAQHPNTGATLLTVATFCGKPETVEMLLKNGADPNQKNKDQATPLHVAVFMGRVESAKLLVDAGASLETKDGAGNTPIDNLNIDFATTKFIASLYGQQVNEKELVANRGKIAKLLGDDHTEVTVSTSSGSEAVYGQLFHLPVFMHLWFLAFLCWLVAAFSLYSIFAKQIVFGRLAKWWLCSPLSLLFLVPLTMLPQYFMMSGMFGPDPSAGILPIPKVLGYYAVFFFYGAIYWELKDNDGTLGRHWYIYLPFALLVVFPIGLDVTMGTFGMFSPQWLGNRTPLLGNFLQALFAWLMIFGLIGMFRSLLSRENRTIRYVSDSSYWMYLVHLPLVMLAQWLVRDWQIPSIVKFTGIIVVISVILLVTYEYLVRYTVIGRILNGPKQRKQHASTT